MVKRKMDIEAVEKLMALLLVEFGGDVTSEVLKIHQNEQQKCLARCWKVSL
jgi:hypothetical protein